MRRIVIALVILALVAGGVVLVRKAVIRRDEASHFRLSIVKLSEDTFRLDLRQKSGDGGLRIRVGARIIRLKKGSDSALRSFSYWLVSTAGSKPDSEGYVKWWSETYRLSGSGSCTVTASIEAREKGSGAASGGCPICGLTIRAANSVRLDVR